MLKNRKMLIILPFLLISSIAAAAQKEPDAGSDDCYNRATQTCNRELPGKDMGDAGYRQCINDTLDWCDANEPSTHAGGLLPALDLSGRFVDARGSTKGETPPTKGGKRIELRCVEVAPGKQRLAILDAEAATRLALGGAAPNTQVVGSVRKQPSTTGPYADANLNHTCALMTKLDKPLRRELQLDDAAYTLTIDPKGLKLVEKGHRKGIELTWRDLISGDAALAVALQASVLASS